jgi:hypothetical protein
MRFFGQKQGPWAKALCFFSVAFLPVFAQGFDSATGEYRLRDDVNTGGKRQSNGEYILSGSVGNVVTNLLGNEDYSVVAGPQNSFFFPAPITDLSLVPHSHDTLLMGWTAPAAGVEFNETVASYEIRRSLSPINDDNFKEGVLRGVEGITPLDPGTLHENVPFSGLTYDTPYYVGIVSYDNNIPSNMSYVGSAGPIWTLAKLPSIISLSSDASNRSVTLTFSPENPDNHELRFQGVISTSTSDPTPGNENTGTVTLDSDSSNDPRSMVFTKILRRVHSEIAEFTLRRGPLYFVHLRAYNRNNDPTAWQMFGPVDIDRRLPTGLTASSLSASSFTVAWVNQISDGDYQVHVATEESFTSPIILPTLKANINSQEFTGLKGNTGYFYKVRAWDSGEVDPISDTTFGSTVTHVLKPVSVGADSLSTDGATLIWQDDADNSTDPHSFHVELATKPFDTNPSIIDGPEVTFSGSRRMEAVVGSLKPNTPYYVRITGKNSASVQSQGSDVFVSADPVFYTLPAQPEVTIVDSLNPTYEISFTLDGKENDPLQTAYVAKVYASPDCTTDPVNDISIAPGMSLSGPFTFSSQDGKPIYANAQYSVCVTAEGHAKDSVSVTKSTFTKPLPAQAMDVVLESSHTVNVTWEDGAGVAQNASTTNYELEWRLDGDPTLIGMKLISVLGAEVEGLTANTTYQFKLTAVQAEESGWGNSEAKFKFGVTLATVPVPGAFTLDANSAIVEWDPNGNPVSTAYQVKLRNESEVDFPSGSIEKGIPQATVSGLTPNTTYWAWARAINHEEEPTNWTVWGPKATDPNLPNEVAAELKGDGSKNVDIKWGVNGNPAGTTYIVKVIRFGTSDTFDAPFKFSSPILQSETAVKLESTFSELIPNTTYRVRVDAVGHNGRVASSDVQELSTQASMLADPILSAGEIDPLRQIKVAWTDDENPTGTKYVVEIATSDAFFRGPGTLTQSPDDDLTKEGEKDFSHLFSSLVPNRRYFGHVGTKAGTSAPVFGTAISTYTFPDTPTELVPVATGVGATHRIAFSWLAGENEPTGTRYQLELARDNEFVHTVGTYPVGFGQTVLEVPVDLEANREYFAHVGAVGNVGGGIMSGWSLSASTYTAVAAPSVVSVDSDTNTLKVTWAGGAGRATNALNTKYKLTWETERVSSSLTSTPPELTLTARELTPNTTYTLNVAALPGTGSFWPDGVALVGDWVTLATTPVAGSYTLFTSSAFVTWGNNENPLGKTLYRVEVDTDEDFSSADKFSETRALSTHVTGLAPNTTYYGQMKAINHANTGTRWVPVWAASATYAAVPSLALGDFTLYSDSGTVTWNPNGNPAGTRYKVWFATEATFGIAPRWIDVSQTTAGDVKVSQELTDLVSNQPYYVRVDVLGHNGATFSSRVFNKNTSAGLVPDVVLSPSGDKTRELTLQWDNRKNSPETSYVVEISTDSNFNVAVTTQETTPANANQHLFGPALISNKRYYAHVKAHAGESNYSTVASTYTYPVAPHGLVPIPVVVGQETNHVAFRWSDGRNAPENTRYRVDLSSGISFLAFASSTTNPGTDAVEFTEADGVVWGNQEYFARVRALAASGSGHNSEEVFASTFTAPLAPKAPRLVSRTTATLTVEWLEPSLAIGERVVENAVSVGDLFKVEWSSLSGSSSDLVPGGAPTYHYVMGENTPLTPNTTYTISVKTIPKVGSDWPPSSVSFLGVTQPSTATLTLSGIIVYQTSMTVSWGANGNPSGTHFQVEILRPKDGWITYPTMETTLNTPAGGLIPATLYSVRVKAIGSDCITLSNIVSQNTLPVPPEITSVTKPAGDLEGQKLELHWNGGGNSDTAVYQSRKTPVLTDDWTPAPGQVIFSQLFEKLNPNTKYKLDVHAGNSSSYSVATGTEVWTRAEIPSEPRSLIPLTSYSTIDGPRGTMGIGFPLSRNPEDTYYAIRMTSMTSLEEEEPKKYARILSAGQASFSSDVFEWHTRADWLSSGKLVLQDLPLDPGYRIVLYAKNHADEVEGPGLGLLIQQSAGPPLVTLLTVNGTVTNLQPRENKIYFNKTMVPFTAANSSHFNVLWGASETSINDGNVVGQTYGWNGKNDPTSSFCPSVGDHDYTFGGSLSGFCAPEGEYYLNITGTALVETADSRVQLLTDEKGNTVFVPTEPFHVFIDTTPPVPPELQLSFLPTPFEPLLQDTLYGNPNPTFVWGTEDTLGNSVSSSPILGWTYSVSTDPDVLPVQSTDPANGFIPFKSDPAISVDLHDVTHSSGTVYYRVRGCDLAGNWTPNNRVPAFRYLYTPDQVLPELAGVEMDGKLFPALDKTIRYAAVTPKEEFLHVKFSEPMLISTHAIQLTLLRGADGRSVNQAVALSTIDASVGIQGDGKQLLPFASLTQLEPGCLYRFFTSSSPMPTDRANNPLTAKLDILFYTAMDPATPAVFASEQGDVSVNVSAFALGTDPVGVAINDRPDKISVAGSPSLPRLLDEANDALSRQRGGAFKKIFVAKELTAFKTNGEMRAQNFPGSVQMGFDYAAYVGANGRMDGTTIKTKDLVLCELDERTGVWNKIPNSRVDEANQKVFAPLRHNGTYALAGAPNYDLADAHPYPVPYRSARDEHGITFTGLSSFGTIKVFTLDGRLVKTLAFNGESSVAWEPVTSDSGESVGSDVYLYMIENDQQRIVGKLMVIR